MRLEDALALPQSRVGDLNIRLDDRDNVLVLINDDDINVLDAPIFAKLLQDPSDNASHDGSTQSEEGAGGSGSSRQDGEDVPEEEGSGRCDESKDGQCDTEGRESREDGDEGDRSESDAGRVEEVTGHRLRLEERAHRGHSDDGVLREGREWSA